ncbi:hypothetical protein [Saccharothrix sp. ST-888]|uniref:hypothetical protein n=1 Tax=Saccharothrix sp. ST-888 TaxID=1427391 RepID=UPI0005ED061C|nr:hypothetical protein [Saccharothrix sp. ST-888]KJK56323.1 hypothetical protein UK12_23290 [Saccharothrix sp. ST-888]
MAEQVHALRVVGRSGVLAWRKLPVSQLPGRIRRKAGRHVAAGRDHLIHSVVAPRAEGTAAVVKYAMVLGGHNLNLHAWLPPETPADATVELMVGNGTRHFSVPARLSAAPGGRPSVTASALLGKQVGGLPVTGGRWSLALRVTAPGGVTEERRLIGVGETPTLTGPSAALAACPVSGMSMQTGISPSGRLKLVVSEPPARAELVRVVRRFAGLQVEFRPPGPRGRLEATDGRQVIGLSTEPVSGSPELLRSTLPLADLHATHQGSNWGFRWVGESGRKYWLRRRPDDLRSVRVMLNTGVKLVITDRKGRLHYVTQRHTIRGIYRLSFSPVPGPAAPGQQSISTATTGSLT